MKSVLHVTHSQPSKDSRILRAAKILARSGLYEVTVIGLAPSRINSSLGPIRIDYEPGIVLIEMPTTTLTGSKLGKMLRGAGWPGISAVAPFVALAAFKFVFTKQVLIHLADGERITRNLDVVHCHDWYMLGAARKIAKRSAASLVYDAHELESRMTHQTRMRSVIARIVERRFWPDVSLFLTASPKILDHYVDTYGRKNAGVFLNVPEIPTTTEPNPPSIRKYLGIGPEKTLIASVGSITFGRGLDIILEAARACPDSFHFAFLGSGPLMERVIEESRYLSNISIVPPVPGHEVTSFLRDADVSLCLIEPVSLSYEYSLPNKLFESLFASVPVVCTPRSEILRVINEVGGGIVLSEVNSATLIQAIQKARKLPPAEPAALEPYSWKKLSNDLLEKYSEIC